MYTYFTKFSDKNYEQKNYKLAKIILKNEELWANRYNISKLLLLHICMCTYITVPLPNISH